MSARGIFPTKLDEQNKYFIAVVAYLILNQARLLISAGNMALLNKLYSNPGVPNDQLGWVELWLLHTGPSAGDRTITALLQQRLRQHLATDPVGMENVLRAIYADIPQSILTAVDRKTLNLKERKARNTIHQVATKNTVVWKSVGLGGGDVLSKCHPSGTAVANPSASSQRGTAQTGRASKEIGYEIHTSYIVLAPGAPLPTNPNATGMTLVVDTRARMVRHLGTASVGSILCEFKQWHKPKHPELDSPWAGPETCIIT
jgi:hypothetical protein